MLTAFRFSALQRAENSSKTVRKFDADGRIGSFSALQRAENSSNQRQQRSASADRAVSVLFSEPKIPQIPRRTVTLDEL